MFSYLLIASGLGALIGWIGRSAAASGEIARVRNDSWKDCLRHYRIDPQDYAGVRYQREQGTADIRAKAALEGAHVTIHRSGLYGTPSKPFES